MGEDAPDDGVPDRAQVRPPARDVDLRGGPPGEERGPAARRELVGDHPEAPHVRGRRVAPAPQDLRRGVDGDGHGGEPPGALPAEPEVGDGELRPGLVEEDVRGPQVAVREGGERGARGVGLPGPVEVGEPRAHLAEDGDDHLARGELPSAAEAPDGPVEGACVAPHLDVDVALVPDDAPVLDDVRVAEAREGPELELERGLRVGGQPVGRDLLDRPVGGALQAVDGPVGPAPELCAQVFEEGVDGLGHLFNPRLGDWVGSIAWAQIGACIDSPNRYDN